MNDEEWDVLITILVAVAAFIAGLQMAEIDNDIVNLEVLNETCHKLYGNNTEYVEALGVAGKFECRTIQPQIPDDLVILTGGKYD